MIGWIRIDRAVFSAPAVFEIAAARGVDVDTLIGRAVAGAIAGHPLPELARWIRAPQSPRTKRPRARIPARVRRAVFARDGRHCVACGATERLSLDHIEFHARGGADTVDNLRVLCLPCNVRRQPPRGRAS